MQLSELEEEMDQRIQAAEHKTRKDVSLWDWPILSPSHDGAPFTDGVPDTSVGFQALSMRAFLAVVVSGGDGGERERDNK